jgi:hypothetical protein
MKRLAIAAAALFFFVNPGFGCSDQDAEYQYGEAEMKAAVEGTWVLTLGEAAGPSNETITVRVVQGRVAQASRNQAPGRRGFIRTASACGTRTFVASANACIDSSDMPLDVTWVDGPDSYKSAALSGSFAVLSLVFTRGQFGLSFGSVSFYADIAPDGSVLTVHGYRNEGGVVPVVSLVRSATTAN